MKLLYDRKSQNPVIRPEDKDLVLLPVQGITLQARYHGPYKVSRRVGDLDYVNATLYGRKSTQLCHLNMVKKNIYKRGL